MINRNVIIETLKNQYQTLSEQFGIERIGLFGSMARGNETEDSDIDLLVELNKPLGFKFTLLVESLEAIFNQKVDVITKDGLENIRIKRVSDSIKKDIIYV
jgi:predicted nucleotidyltransferase